MENNQRPRKRNAIPDIEMRMIVEGPMTPLIEEKIMLLRKEKPGKRIKVVIKD